MKNNNNKEYFGGKDSKGKKMSKVQIWKKK